MAEAVMHQPSDMAIRVYRRMIEDMDRDGFVDFEGCLSVSLAEAQQGDGLKGLNKLLAELVRADWVFPQPELGGWRVCLPVRA